MEDRTHRDILVNPIMYYRKPVLGQGGGTIFETNRSEPFLSLHTSVLLKLLQKGSYVGFKLCSSSKPSVSFIASVDETKGVPQLISIASDFSADIDSRFNSFAKYIEWANIGRQEPFRYLDLVYSHSDHRDAESYLSLHAAYYQTARAYASTATFLQVLEVFGIHEETRIPSESSLQCSSYWLDNYFVELAPATLFTAEGFRELGFIPSVAAELELHFTTSVWYKLQLPKYWLASYFREVFQYTIPPFKGNVGKLRMSQNEPPTDNDYSLIADSVLEQMDALPEEDFNSNNGFYLLEGNSNADAALSWASTRYPESDLAVLFFFVRKQEWDTLTHFDMEYDDGALWQSVVSFYRCFEQANRLNDEVSTTLDLSNYHTIRGLACGNPLQVRDGIVPSKISPLLIQIVLRQQVAVDLLHRSTMVVVYIPKRTSQTSREGAMSVPPGKTRNLQFSDVITSKRGFGSTGRQQ
eukprot:gene7615-8416_t